MKLSLLLIASVFTAFAALPAAEPAAAAPDGDFSAFKTADEFWQHLGVLQRQPTEKPATREEGMAQAQAWFAAQQKAGEAFVKAFPEDARRWPAKLLALRAGLQLRRFNPQPGPTEVERAKLDEIINAADASAQTKADAAFTRAMTYTADFKNKPESYIAFHQAVADFSVKYPTHQLLGQIQATQLRALADDPTPQGAELLKKMAAGTDAKQAEAAKGILTKRERMAEIRIRPLDLQFTATNGQDVDLALMRGKVVLVSFWASGDGPSMAEMPNIVAAYQKLRPKGLEVVGVSLDQDKGKMQEAAKALGMTWRQHFDGGGLKNKISSSYGIDSLPTTWLIDKKGRLRESSLRGPALEQAVERLLRE